MLNTSDMRLHVLHDEFSRLFIDPILHFTLNIFLFDESQQICYIFSFRCNHCFLSNCFFLSGYCYDVDFVAHFIIINSFRMCLSILIQIYTDIYCIHKAVLGQIFFVVVEQFSWVEHIRFVNYFLEAFLYLFKHFYVDTI